MTFLQECHSSQLLDQDAVSARHSVQNGTENTMVKFSFRYVTQFLGYGLVKLQGFVAQ